MENYTMNTARYEETLKKAKNSASCCTEYLAVRAYDARVKKNSKVTAKLNKNMQFVLRKMYQASCKGFCYCSYKCNHHRPNRYDVEQWCKNHDGMQDTIVSSTQKKNIFGRQYEVVTIKWPSVFVDQWA